MLQDFLPYQIRAVSEEEERLPDGLKGGAGMKFYDLIVLTSHTEFVNVCVHAKASVDFIPCNDSEQARNA